MYICQVPPIRFRWLLARRERAKSLAGIENWTRENPNSHVIDYDSRNLRWRCSRCQVNGALGFGARFAAALRKPCGGYGKRPGGAQSEAAAAGPPLAKRQRRHEPASSHFPRRGVG